MVKRCYQLSADGDAWYGRLVYWQHRYIVTGGGDLQECWRCGNGWWLSVGAFDAVTVTDGSGALLADRIFS